MAQGYRQDRELREVSVEAFELLYLGDDWLRHVNALDNLLTLYGLERLENVFGGGFIIFHRDVPNLTRWISAHATEESWLDDVKLLAR